MKKKWLLVFTGFIAAVFIFNSMDTGYAKRKKAPNENKIIKEMNSRNTAIAVSAIRKAPSLQLKRNKHKAVRILINIVKRKKLNSQIRIAAADALASMNAKGGKKVLQRMIKNERNSNVKNAFRSALTKYGASPGGYGTPSYGGTPGYGGTAGY